MFDRDALSSLLKMLDRHASVALFGPRQVGETTLALQVAQTRPATYLDLENPADRAKLSVRNSIWRSTSTGW